MKLSSIINFILAGFNFGIMTAAIVTGNNWFVGLVCGVGCLVLGVMASNT